MAKKMTEDFLQSVVKSEIVAAVGYIGGNLTEQRREALDQYYQEPFGGELEGRSHYVTSDVQDTVEALMPDLMEIFAGSDEVCKFEPRQEEDVPVAEQATEYVNYILNNDNDFFEVAHDFIKDALLQKNGVAKTWWDDAPIEKREVLESINSFALAQLDADDEIEIVEQDEREASEEELPFAPDGVIYDVTILKTTENGRVKIAALPPEEFLITRRATTLKEADFTCHKVRKTKSQLLKEGYPRKVIDELPTYNEQEFNEERVNRFNFDEEWPETDQAIDPAQEEVWLYECYLMVDWDGDGISEMRQVTVAGPGYKVLDNESVDDHPFVSITPIKMPHKFYGRSMADLVADIQLVKSTVVRQFLDNLYFINNGRTAISNRVNMEDMLTNRPGGIVQTDVDGGVGEHFMPITTQPLGQVILPALEYFDSIRETRTGVTRYNQGLDADSLNKTASGISQILNQSQRRLMLIARLFAEMGFRPLFKKVLHLVVNHQDRERVIRLRNEWVPIDPRGWDIDMDVSISVGLGHGTQQQRAIMAREMLGVQEKVIQYQGGLDGPLVTMKEIHNSLRTFSEANGFKGNQFFADPSGQEPQQPKGPSPEEQAMQMQMELEKAKLQIEQQKMQLDQKKMEITAQESAGKMQLEQAKLEATGQEAVNKIVQAQEQFTEEMRLKWAEYESKYSVEGQKLELDGSKAQTDFALRERETELAAQKAGTEAELAAERLASDERAHERSEKAKPEAKTNGKAGLQTINVNMPAGGKKVTVERDVDGKVTGATVGGD